MLFCSGVLPQPLFVHFINFLQLKTQVSSLCSVCCAVCCALSCLRIGRSRFVQRTTTGRYVQLLPSVEYQIHRMNASQAGIHRHTQAEGRQSQSASQRQQQQAAQYDANAGTENVSVFVYLLHVCICVFRSFVRSVRFVGLFALCAQSRGNSTAQRTHTYTHTQPTYVCIWLWHWPGPAFIVCVAEQKFCCSLYEHTATVAAAAAARASSWTVAGHMQRWWWGRGGVRPTATSTEYGRLPAWLALRQTVCSELSCS